MEKTITKSFTINGKIVKKYFYFQEEADAYSAKIIAELSDKYLENEIWVTPQNYSRYEVSNFGRIMSKDHRGSGIRRLINPAIGKDGYWQSMFKNDSGKYETRKVHKMITLGFFGECPTGLEINHKDGNKSNNSIENLEYITHSANCKHSFDKGLQKAKRGDLNGMSKLTWEQVDYIREQKKLGGKYWGRTRIAKELGISSKHIQDIANSKTLWQRE